MERISTLNLALWSEDVLMKTLFIRSEFDLKLYSIEIEYKEGYLPPRITKKSSIDLEGLLAKNVHIYVVHVHKERR